MSDKHNIILLQDYTPPPYLVTTVDLRFELDENATQVSSELAIMRNPRSNDERGLLELDGKNLDIRAVRLDGEELAGDRFHYDGSFLRIADVPDRFTLEVDTVVRPADNTELEGLYLSSGNFCTQCEAEGFRRITCYPDRPDVMAVFTTTIIADRKKYPVLLSNGNLVEEGTLDEERHYVVWHDPFKKPSYLFALVAGNLVFIEDIYRTRSGREVTLRIYVEPRNREKCGHAMESLRKAMQWDEETFGLEYDLDMYMIVAVDDFNMGAMENKGLNVFNSKYVLARPETATDADYEAIEAVIAHEYFHNWTGNRVTCRDWFQLSLKEGLTVFRDQEFSADMTSRPVKRIHDVKIMRNYQFREDAGPMAHPIRPESYMAVNNFYTLTVYDKGAEVIRMLHALLGSAGFSRGLRLYLERNDGQAATCDDFIDAMIEANDDDLDGFRLWYSQAGTPLLRADGEYDPDRRQYRLRLQQSCPPTPGQSVKQPMLMPVAVGLLDSSGRDMELHLQGDAGQGAPTRVLRLREAEQAFTFTDIPEKPVLSCLRNYSAPVKLSMERSAQELAFVMAHDSDPFNRWDAGQQLALQYILEQIEVFRKGGQLQVPDTFTAAFREVLMDRDADPAFIAQAISLPMDNWIGEQMDVIDPEAIFRVLRFFRCRLNERLRSELFELYSHHRLAGPYSYNAEDASRRTLKNTCLGYLLSPDRQDTVPAAMLDIALSQYAKSNNMTDTMAALRAVVNGDRGKGDELLAAFYQEWKNDPLVIDKWLSLQALCTLHGTLDRVKQLAGHPAFSIKNPNKVRALIGAFCSGNMAAFHAPDGQGYRFLCDIVLRLDPMNPQIAARLLTPLTTWRRYDTTRQQLMRGELERIRAEAKLSGDVAEVVGKSLHDSD